MEESPQGDEGKSDNTKAKNEHATSDKLIATDPDKCSDTGDLTNRRAEGKLWSISKCISLVARAGNIIAAVGSVAAVIIAFCALRNTQNVAKLSQDAAKLSERQYVFLKQIIRPSKGPEPIPGATDLYMIFRAKWVNGGHGITKDLIIKDACNPDGKFTFGPESGGLWQQRATIGPADIDSYEENVCIISNQRWIEYSEGHKMVTVFGQATYDDSSGKHVTQFCRELRNLTRDWQYELGRCADHNCADEACHARDKDFDWVTDAENPSKVWKDDVPSRQPSAN